MSRYSLFGPIYVDRIDTKEHSKYYLEEIVRRIIRLRKTDDDFERLKDVNLYIKSKHNIGGISWYKIISILGKSSVIIKNYRNCVMIHSFNSNIKLVIIKEDTTLDEILFNPDSYNLAHEILDKEFCKPENTNNLKEYVDSL